MKKTSAYLLLAALATLGLGSCNKLIEGADINPNAPLDAPSDQQLTAALIGEGFVMGGEAARTASIFAGVFTGEDRQYSALQNYTAALPDFDNMWTNSYYLTIQQARLVQEKARAVNNNQLLGIAQVVEAQMIGTVTALWGDVPYSKAFVSGQAATFDAQRDVYAAIQSLLSDAITNLGKNGVSPGSRDIYYGGTPARWIAAARSLKARYYLHTARLTPVDYASAASEARLGITGSANDMLMPYDGTLEKSVNPYYDFLDYNRGGYMSANTSYADSLLGSRNNAKTDESNRQDYFFDHRAGAANYFDVDPNFVDGAFAADADFPLVTYVETRAILAEALLMQTAPDFTGALAALNAIRTSNATTYGGTGGRYLAYVAADFTAGGLLNSRSPALSPSGALRKEILIEKYTSLVGQIENFNDVRRTNNLIGVPKNVASAPSLPQRFLIPQVEVNTNPNAPRNPPGVFVKTPVNN